MQRTSRRGEQSRSSSVLRGLQIAVPAALTVVLFVVAGQAVFIPAFRDNMMAERKATLEELTRSACSVFAECERWEQLGLLTHDQAQDRSIDILRAWRYGRNDADYFWVTDLKPVMIMHPYRPDLDGTDVSGYEDTNGKHLFVEFANAALARGEGFVDYTWELPGGIGDPVPKLSHVRLFEPWGWVLGTGIYVEDVAAEARVAARRLWEVSSGILAMIVIAAGYMIWRNLAAERLRLAAEQASRESEEKYRLLADHASDCVYWLAEDKSIVYMSPACRRLTGFSQDDFYERPALLNTCVHPDEGFEWFNHALEMATSTGADAEEFRIITLAGETKWVSHVCTAIHDEKGAFLGVRGSARDITPRKLAEFALAERTDELSRANEALRRRNQELDEFTYVASHDLQGPLRQLSSFSDMLPGDLGTDLNDRARTDLSYIKRAALRMSALVQDLLALSRAGRTAMKQERIELRRCARDAQDGLASEIAQRGATITQDPLPEVTGDRTMLTQVYQNLIGNALKFSEGTPKIHLTAVEEDGILVLGVRDNGIGIEQNLLHKVFEPFKRLHGQEQYEGSGIGLGICSRVVERHGGKIWVESEIGQGSHFRFTLPEGALTE
ncbi:MAG: PAS domain S-box protein [bacterium]|nr:PAS domain S-box protein [bacterium]